MSDSGVITRSAQHICNIIYLKMKCTYQTSGCVIFVFFAESQSSISESPESDDLLNDMIACLDSESAAWVKTAPL